MKVLPRGIRNNYQTEVQITIRIQLTLQYETRNKYLLKAIGIQISQIFVWSYWKTDRLNHGLTRFRQIHKTINTDTKAH